MRLQPSEATRNSIYHRPTTSFAAWACCLLACLLCLVLTGNVAMAQAAAADDETAEVEEPKFPGDEKYEPVVPGPTALTDPAVRAILGSPRQSAADHLRATKLLLQLGQPELAAGEFHRLLKTKPDDATKVELVNQFGPAIVMELARTQALGPAARPFAESMMAAYQADAQSGKRVAELVSQLGSNDKLEQRRAVAGLAGAGQAAVMPLIQLLADESSSEPARQGARATLVRLGPLAERPLLATLDSHNSKLVAEAAEVLAAIRSSDAAPLLAVPALGGGSAARAYQSLTGQTPSPESAKGLLTRTLKTIEGGAPIFPPNTQGKVTYWVWDEKGTPGPAPEIVTAAEANTLYGAKLAQGLAALQPGVPSVESKSLRLQIEAVGILGRYGMEAGFTQELLEDLPADSLNQLLADALKAQQADAARLALLSVADRHDAGMLSTSNGQPSPTAKALLSPHPSVRAAAVEAIAAIDSPTPFPWSSKVCPTIVELASARGERLALAAAPRIDTAATWAGGLASMGIASEVANTGEQLFEKANLLADVELILIDMSLNHPAVRDVVYQLRTNPSTALVPIALVAREPQLASARSIASEHEHVIATLRPHNDQAMQELVTRLLAQLPSSWPTAEQRIEQRVQAIKSMNHLLDNERTFYRLRAASDEITQSVYPASDATWQLLSRLGTRDSQLALLTHASSANEAIASRQAAAKAFADSVGRFGVRITADEIVHQYDLYNASAKGSKESQQVLGDILDTLEKGKQTN